MNPIREELVQKYRATITEPQDTIPFLIPGELLDELDEAIRHAVDSGEQTYGILAGGGGDHQRYVIEELLPAYRALAALIIQTGIVDD